MGLDYAFLNGRISGTIDLYDKLSSGVLMNRDIPIETGWTAIKDNVGSVSNKGIEFSLRTVNVSTKNFTWNTSFTLSRNKNAIVDLLDKKEDLVGNWWFIGQPINVNYTYVFDGIWQESEREQALKFGQSPGQAKVKDLNNDGKSAVRTTGRSSARKTRNGRAVSQPSLRSGTSICRRLCLPVRERRYSVRSIASS